MSTIHGKDANGWDWIQYTSKGPKYKGRFHYGVRSAENYFFVWRDDQSRAFECGNFEDVQSVVRAWTMQEWHEPRWDVQVFDNAERSGRPVFITSHWTKDKAQETMRKINAGPSLQWANVRRVAWEEYSKE